MHWQQISNYNMLKRRGQEYCIPVPTWWLLESRAWCCWVDVDVQVWDGDADDIDGTANLWRSFFDLWISMLKLTANLWLLRHHIPSFFQRNPSNCAFWISQVQEGANESLMGSPCHFSLMDGGLYRSDTKFKNYAYTIPLCCNHFQQTRRVFYVPFTWKNVGKCRAYLLNTAWWSQPLFFSL